MCPDTFVDWCFYVMFIYSSVSWWIWMFVVATAGPVAPLLTMHINVFLKVMDCQSNLRAFSQDLLLRGYAHGRKHKSRHELRGLHLCGCQQCDNSVKSRGCCLSSSVLCFWEMSPNCLHAWSDYNFLWLFLFCFVLLQLWTANNATVSLIATGEKGKITNRMVWIHKMMNEWNYRRQVVAMVLSCVTLQ